MLLEELLFEGGERAEKGSEVDPHHQTWTRGLINRCGSEYELPAFVCEGARLIENESAHKMGVITSVTGGQRYICSSTVCPAHPRKRDAHRCYICQHHSAVLRVCSYFYYFEEENSQFVTCGSWKLSAGGLTKAMWAPPPEKYRCDKFPRWHVEILLLLFEVLFFWLSFPECVRWLTASKACSFMLGA